MHKTLSQEEYHEPEETHTSPSFIQRNHSTRLRRPQKDFYSDEHPEIPQYRRASLQLDQVAPALSPTHKPTPHDDTPRDLPLTDKLPRHKKISRPPSSTVRRPRPRRLPSLTARRSAIYQAPPSVYDRTRRSRRLRKQQPHSPLIGQQRLLLAGAILVALIALPLISNAIFGSGPLQSILIGFDNNTSGPGTNTQSSSRQLVIVPANKERPAPPVYATAAYLLDADTGTTLYAHNPFLHLPILSTTKLMTALLAVEQGNLDQKITINDAIERDLNDLSSDSSLMGLKKGETYTLRELLYGLILVSGNDAAVAIADSLSGSMPQFVMRMNQRATELGLHDTHFMNPHGLLANGHYSSAHDLAFLGRYSLNIPVIHQITGTREYRIRKNAAHPERFLTNSNQFLWWYPGADGGKPGWDGNKNFVQVITCQQNKRRLIGVTIHTNDWWTDMRNLMNWGFNTFKWISPAEIQQTSPIPFAAAWNFFVQDKKDNSIPTTDKGRYYIYTGYSVSNPILTYFEKNGGLKKFGFPISMPVTSFNTVVSQKFERGTLQCDLGTKQCHSS